jgi:excisionase family DNA binding protein
MKHPLLDYEVQRPPRFAKLVGVSKPTVMAWIKSGKLKAHRIGARYYIPDSELARLLQESTQVGK